MSRFVGPFLCLFRSDVQLVYGCRVISTHVKQQKLRFKLGVDLRTFVCLSRLLLFGAGKQKPSAMRRIMGRSTSPWHSLAFKASSAVGSEHSDDQRSNKLMRPSGQEENGNENGKRPLRLMDFKEILWPHPVKWVRNLLFSALIKGYYDEHFSLPSFLKGAEQAVSVVAQMISRGQFEELEGLVSRQVIQEVRRNYWELSSQQRQFVEVNSSDLFFRFVYEIGMIFDDDTDQRFVEITTVFQGFHGLNDAKQKDDPISITEEMYKAQDQIYVCNYRFIREFTKGVKDDWTINKLNHFCPTELVARTGYFDR